MTTTSQENSGERNQLLQEASEHVADLLKNQLGNNYLYHNFSHTLSVVEAAREIGAASGLNGEEMELVELAAWFHDVGYVDGSAGHEERSADMAAEFLARRAYPAEKIDSVRSLILVTKYPPFPQTMMEKVLCDADLHHVGLDTYLDSNDLLRVEWEHAAQERYDDVEWMKKSVNFLMEHQFFTDYAIARYQPNKMASIAKLKKKVRKRKRKEEEDSLKIKVQKKKLETIKNKQFVPDRGIETMFRVTMRNHINLSAIADNKANMLISVNAIIISIVVSLLVGNLEANGHLIAPTLMLLTVCVVTLIFATISTRPQVTEGTFTQSDVKERRVNLLFFGNFFNVTLDDYVWGMREMMSDREYLYDSLTKDLFFLGRVLSRKYKFLRISYDVFMYGLILSILAFAVAVLTSHPA